MGLTQEAGLASQFVNESDRRTIKDIVLSDFRAAGVFEKFGLDFCCGGGKTVQEACEKRGIDQLAVNAELEALGHSTSASGATPRFQNWPLSLLIDYIESNHHFYIKSVSSRVMGHAQKVAGTHAQRWPYMVEVASIFDEVVNELTSHMFKEEKILFPRIKQLESSADKASAEALSGPIQQMMLEHDAAGEMLDRIRELTSNYTLPEGGCMTFRTLLAELQEFERDLHQHVFLENNILFPKAQQMTSSCSIPTR